MFRKTSPAASATTRTSSSVHTITRVSPAVATPTSSILRVGYRRGTTEFDGAECRLVPMEFVAVTVKV